MVLLVITVSRLLVELPGVSKHFEKVITTAAFYIEGHDIRAHIDFSIVQDLSSHVRANLIG